MSYFALAKGPRAVSRRAALLKGVALASGVGMAGCAVTVPTHIRPITGFDITKYTGTWYEIARIDHWFEKGLVNTSAQYNIQADGSLQVVNRGFDPGKTHGKRAWAKPCFWAIPVWPRSKCLSLAHFMGAATWSALTRITRWPW